MVCKIVGVTFCAIFFDVVLYVNLVSGVYFSMSDITMELHKDNNQLPPENHALATLYVLQEERENSSFLPRFSIEHQVGKNLAIYPSTGDIMFTSTFRNESIESITNITARTAVEDRLGRKNYSTFRVEVSPVDTLDCDLIIEDLCYWKAVSYRIFENRKPSTIGSLTSPYLLEMCKGFTVNYELVEGQSSFELGPPTNETPSWTIRSKKALERDIVRLRESEKNFDAGDTLNILVKCVVIDSSKTRRELHKNISIKILDEDDNVPKPQKKGPFRIHLDSMITRENDTVHDSDFVLIDIDSKDVNHYDVQILNDNLNILRPNLTVFDDWRDEERQTVIHCKLIFTRSMEMTKPEYNVVLRINDTSLLPQFGSGVVDIPIQLIFKSSERQNHLRSNKVRKPLILYPSRDIKIFKTASVLARVTQPKKPVKNVTNFQIFSDPEFAGLFNITRDGVVFVENTTLIRNSRIGLKIQWSKNKKIEFDEVEVIVTNEPEATCVNSLFEEGCSESASIEDCLKSCGLGTGGSANVEESKKSHKGGRCMWQGSAQGSINETHIYSTCTPDRSTCPDGVCDSLEQLYYLLCPQDCAEQEYVQFPISVNKQTGRGIVSATGIIHCDSVGHCHNFSKQKKKSRKNPTTSSTTTTTENSNEIVTLPSEPNLSRHVGVDVASCGTKCILGIAAGSLFLICAVAAVVACWKLDRVHKGTRDKFSSDTQDLNVPLSDYVDRGVLPDSIHLNFDMSGQLGHTVNYVNKMAPDPKWEFPRNHLIIEQTLGEGEFGRVLRARAKDIGALNGYTTVAVKTLKDDAREPELADLLSEYQLLKEVSHPNVIRLLGACTLPGGPVYLIIEYAQYGSLRSYLRRSRHLKSESLPPSSLMRFEGFQGAPSELYDEPVVNEITPKDILSFGWQICNGMSYLSDIKLVHRDLAARNVLVATGKICKISDFGLTRDVYEDDAYYKRSKGRVPVKWMAPESLSDHIYTNKSDVWSFGILVWELVTLGATPYPGIQVQNLFHLLKSGYRMERPENCSPALYKIMRSCWHIDPEQRPSFSELSLKWEKMLTDIVEYLDLTPNVIHNRSYFCTADNEDDLDETETSKSPDLSESSNLLENSSQYVKCGESNKLLSEETEKAMSSPIAVQNKDIQGYETPVKTRRRVEALTPSNECPQYYTNMCAKKDGENIINEQTANKENGRVNNNNNYSNGGIATISMTLSEAI